MTSESRYVNSIFVVNLSTQNQIEKKYFLDFFCENAKSFNELNKIVRETMTKFASAEFVYKNRLLS